MHREEDGAVHFWRIKENLQSQFRHSPHWSDGRWKGMLGVEESYPTPHIHEQMTTSNYGYDTAYNFTHNNIMLEPNAMNNIDTVAHMNVHNTQY